MPIIFGWRTRASIIARGMFLCPQCGADRHYAHKSMRRWFTLFFIPLIPLKTLGEFVECETCHSKYKTSVLSTPTTASLQEELVAAFREAVVTLLRTGRSPGADAAAIAALTSFSGRQWTAEYLEQDLAHLDDQHLDTRLANLAGVLNEQGKERFVSACAGIAATGGIIDGAGRAAVERIAVGLMMTPAHARGVIDQVLEDSRA